MPIQSPVKKVFEGDIIRNESLPRWSQECFDNCNKQAPNIVWTYNGRYWFDGLIYRLFERHIIPDYIHILFDMRNLACATRLIFGDPLDPKMIIDAPFEMESFAMLWNMQPRQVSGFPGDRITMHLAPHDASIATLHTLDIIGFLSYRDGKFHVTVSTDDLEEAVIRNRDSLKVMQTAH